MLLSPLCSFFSNDTSTPEIYTLSLHDALPICRRKRRKDAVFLRLYGLQCRPAGAAVCAGVGRVFLSNSNRLLRSEEHTSELQSLRHLVCRLLLEKKNDRQRISQERHIADGRYR